MKRIEKVAALYLGVAFALCFAPAFVGCSNGSDPGIPGITPIAPGRPVLENGFDEKLWTTDRLETSHAKVENVSGGLKFTITRPEGDYFNPNCLVKEEGEYYNYLGAGKGDYESDGYEYVGAGKGSYSLSGDYNYSYVGPNNGDYSFVPVSVYEYVGANKGQFRKVSSGALASYYEYVGEGNGNLNPTLVSPYFEDVGAGNGAYKKVEEGYMMDSAGYDAQSGSPLGDYNNKPIYLNVGAGNGYYKREPSYKFVGDKNGDYVPKYKYVGAGQGVYIKDSYKTYGCLGWCSIRRVEMINGKRCETTGADLDYDNWNQQKGANSWTVFYPLCERGERYVFQVHLEPADAENHRELDVEEYVSIIAQDGIGDIDYSNLNQERRVELTYDGEKPTAKVFNCVPPENVNGCVSTIEYFAGTKEFKSGTSYWVGSYSQDVSNAVFDKDPCMETLKSWGYTPEQVELNRTSRCFNATVQSKGKSQFFAEHSFRFKAPEAQGITVFRTIILQSDYAYMN
ncbi:MAG: hypothetical protein IK015_08000 [Treponema sp.]|nr:hypothetical protein [Treponema sp.]